jgi:hypothetical protein
MEGIFFFARKQRLCTHVAAFVTRATKLCFFTQIVIAVCSVIVLFVRNKREERPQGFCVDRCACSGGVCIKWSSSQRNVVQCTLTGFLRKWVFVLHLLLGLTTYLMFVTESDVSVWVRVGGRTRRPLHRDHFLIYCPSPFDLFRQ